VSGPVDWTTLQFMASTLVAVAIGVSAFVATVVWWIFNQVREVDKALAALDKSFHVELANSRHTMRAEMQREAVANEQNDDARRKEISDLAMRVTRLEARLNGNHPKS
jgi:hypothetical protein